MATVHFPRPNPAVNPDRLLTLSDVALRLRCSGRTVQRWAKRGILPGPLRFGRAVRWRASTIERLIAAREQQGAA